ncbi:unnamed protein product [Cuscuta campestris]|uniref:Uncharacterized protein n=1 Tax=Cuscuta campestris TaxID=132261 RepID=A0A484LA93_9ASTE|nr:unnamed protein product [Cuscuta campestris]
MKHTVFLRLFLFYQFRCAMRILDLSRHSFILNITLVVLLFSRVSCLYKVVTPHEKYISQSYFEKHDTLTDSAFEHFVAHEVVYGSCELAKEGEVGLKIMSLDQKLIGEGSHRRLLLSIRLKILLECNSKYQCEAIIIERLPSGLFGDSFELERLAQRGAFKEAGVFGDTNLELPSFRSNRSLIEVHFDMGSKLLSTHEGEIEFKVELPLHARYQPLGHGFSRVMFGPPDLFVRYSTERKVGEKCLFPLDYHTAEPEEVDLVWEIPCGDKDHTEIISAITFISAILSALLIIYVSVYYFS